MKKSTENLLTPIGTNNDQREYLFKLELTYPEQERKIKLLDEIKIEFIQSTDLPISRDTSTTCSNDSRGSSLTAVSYFRALDPNQFSSSKSLKMQKQFFQNKLKHASWAFNKNDSKKDKKKVLSCNGVEQYHLRSDQGSTGNQNTEFDVFWDMGDDFLCKPISNSPSPKRAREIYTLHKLTSNECEIDLNRCLFAYQSACEAIQTPHTTQTVDLQCRNQIYLRHKYYPFRGDAFDRSTSQMATIDNPKVTFCVNEFTVKRSGKLKRSRTEHINRTNFEIIDPIELDVDLQDRHFDEQVLFLGADRQPHERLCEATYADVTSCLSDQTGRQVKELCSGSGSYEREFKVGRDRRPNLKYVNIVRYELIHFKPGEKSNEQTVNSLYEHVDKLINDKRADLADLNTAFPLSHEKLNVEYDLGAHFDLDYARNMPNLILFAVQTRSRENESIDGELRQNFRASYVTSNELKINRSQLESLIDRVTKIDRLDIKKCNLYKFFEFVVYVKSARFYSDRLVKKAVQNHMDVYLNADYSTNYQLIQIDRPSFNVDEVLRYFFIFDDVNVQRYYSYIEQLGKPVNVGHSRPVDTTFGLNNSTRVLSSKKFH